MLITHHACRLVTAILKHTGSFHIQHLRQSDCGERTRDLDRLGLAEEDVVQRRMHVSAQTFSRQFSGFLVGACVVHSAVIDVDVDVDGDGDGGGGEDGPCFSHFVDFLVVVSVGLQACSH